MTKTNPTRTRTTQDMAAGGRGVSFFLPFAALNLAIRSDGSTAALSRAPFTCSIRQPVLQGHAPQFVTYPDESGVEKHACDTQALVAPNLLELGDEERVEHLFNFSMRWARSSS